MTNKIAVFDVDQTLVRGYYILKLADALESLGLFAYTASVGMEKAMSDYRNGRIQYPTVAKRIGVYFAKGIKGQSVDNVKEVGAKYIRDHRAEKFGFTDKLVEMMREKGHGIITVSGSPIEIISPFSEDIGADKVFASTSCTNEGVYTGETERDFSRSTKKYLIKKYISENNIDASQSAGFGDKKTDSGFIGLLGYPVAINPDQEMEEEASKNGWLICCENDDVVEAVRNYIDNGRHLK